PPASHHGAPSHPSSRWRGLDRCVIGVLSSQNPDNATVEQFLGESTRPRALRATRLAHPALTRLTRGVRGPAPRGSRPLAPGTTRLARLPGSLLWRGWVSGSRR